MLTSTDLYTGIMCGLLMLVGMSARWMRDREAMALILGLLAKFATATIFAIWVYRNPEIDTNVYYQHGLEYAEMLQSDPGRYFAEHPFYSVYGNQSERFSSFCGLLLFLTGGSFLASSFLIGAMAYAGQVLLFRAFVERFPQPGIRGWWRIGILLLPSLTWWSGGMLKDSMGIAALGLAFWGVHKFELHGRVKYLGYAILGVFGLILFRMQVVPPFLLALAAFLIRSTIGSARPTNMRVWIGALIIAVALFGVMRRAIEGDEDFALENIPERVSRMGTWYQDTGWAHVAPVATQGTWFAIILGTPAALVNTLLRPFLWDVRNFVMLLSALENLVLTAFTIVAIKTLLANAQSRRLCWRSPEMMFCLAFVLTLGVIVGISTPNLGSASRYRIPLLPFWIAALQIMRCLPQGMQVPGLPGRMTPLVPSQRPPAPRPRARLRPLPSASRPHGQR